MNKTYAQPMVQSQADTVWQKACAALKRELGDDTFGSWVAPAALLESGDGELCVVTPTGIARDWIRRHAWRRIGGACYRLTDSSK